MPDVPRRVRTQAERDADGTAWRAAANTRPGYATYPTTQPGSPSWWERHGQQPPAGSRVHVIDTPMAPGYIPPSGSLNPAATVAEQSPADPDIWVTTEPIAPPRRRWWHRYTRRNP